MHIADSPHLHAIQRIIRRLPTEQPPHDTASVRALAREAGYLLESIEGHTP